MLAGSNWPQALKTLCCLATVSDLKTFLASFPVGLAVEKFTPCAFMQSMTLWSTAGEIFGLLDDGGAAEAGGAAEVVAGAAAPGGDPPQPAAVTAVPIPRLAASSTDAVRRRLAETALADIFTLITLSFTSRHHRRRAASADDPAHAVPSAG
jgi:hypothetical protein